jgi:teichuronic acid biosynthesis glycosyltransferase TuaH
MGTQRFDWDLLLSIAGRHDDWLFYLIGSPFSKLVEKRENLIYVGEIGYDLLHSYTANWDAAIIPFKKNNITITLDNLKVYEYLFLRLPVVARGVGEHFRRYPYVYIAEDERDFENLIERAGSIEMKEDVIVDFLRTADWTARAEEILKIIGVRSRPGAEVIAE